MILEAEWKKLAEQFVNAPEPMLTVLRNTFYTGAAAVMEHSDDMEKWKAMKKEIDDQFK